jgi:uncharacterized protein HemY
MLAQRARDLQPDSGDVWSFLGEAYYRAGKWDEAITALEKAGKLSPGQSNAMDWCYRAMACWQKGDKSEARHWNDKATSWIDEHRSNDVELMRIRAEAAVLLGMTGHPEPDSKTKERHVSPFTR